MSMGKALRAGNETINMVLMGQDAVVSQNGT